MNNTFIKRAFITLMSFALIGIVSGFIFPFDLFFYTLIGIMGGVFLGLLLGNIKIILKASLSAGISVILLFGIFPWFLSHLIPYFFSIFYGLIYGFIIGAVLGICYAIAIKKEILPMTWRLSLGFGMGYLIMTPLIVSEDILVFTLSAVIFGLFLILAAYNYSSKENSV